MQKLAIVGSHPGSREDAPFDDPEYDIWVMNEAAQAPWCKRWDVLFQIHKPEVYTSPNNWIDRAHWEWLQQDHGKVIYMQDADPRVPNSKRYPLDEIAETLPGGRFRWFVSTPAYCLALALYMGYENISLYGLDMGSNTEYGYQLPNFQFWMGVALGMGVHIDDLSNSQYFTGKLYGYEGEVQIDRAYFSARAHEMDAAWKDADREAKRMKSRLVDAIRDRKYQKVVELVAETREAVTKAGEMAGTLAEAENYARRDDPITRQEFERRSARGQRDGEGHHALMYSSLGQVEYLFNAWATSGNDTALQQMRLLIDKMLAHAYDTGAHLGIFRANLDYCHEYDNRVTAAGGQRTLAALGIEEQMQ